MGDTVYPRKPWLDAALTYSAPPDVQGGAGGGGSAQPPAAPAPTAQQPPAQPAPAPPAQPPATPDPGFPADTPIAEMTAEQQAAYWKHQARKHEDRWKGLAGDKTVDQIKADLAEAEQARQAKLTPAEQQLQAAREEGRKAALAEASTSAVKSILTAGLRARGRDDAAITNLIAAANPAAFITEEGIADDTLAAYLDTIAGPVTGGSSNRTTWPDMGQGRRDTNKTTGVSAGRDLFDARRKKTA